ncbi:hypothetical protein GCM10018787_15240 [Streptomyces thermodiastaticus]|nr:hypothetical protein GCM10018787_15240 [Streptomyces thermodiastaticus]
MPGRVRTVLPAVRRPAFPLALRAEGTLHPRPYGRSGGPGTHRRRTGGRGGPGKAPRAVGGAP